MSEVSAWFLSTRSPGAICNSDSDYRLHAPRVALLRASLHSVSDLHCSYEFCSSHFRTSPGRSPMPWSFFSPPPSYELWQQNGGAGIRAPKGTIRERDPGVLPHGCEPAAPGDAFLPVQGRLLPHTRLSTFADTWAWASGGCYLASCSGCGLRRTMEAI